MSWFGQKCKIDELHVVPSVTSNKNEKKKKQNQKLKNARRVHLWKETTSCRFSSALFLWVTPLAWTIHEKQNNSINTSWVKEEKTFPPTPLLIYQLLVCGGSCGLHEFTSRKSCQTAPISSENAGSINIRCLNTRPSSACAASVRDPLLWLKATRQQGYK